MIFIILNMFPLCHILKSCYHKWMWNFYQNLYFIYRSNHMDLSFDLLMWCITLNDLWILKNSCIPGINPTRSWWMILLMYYWSWLASILLNSAISDTDLWFSHFCNIFVWFWYQGKDSLREWVWKCSSLFRFLESFHKDRWQLVSKHSLALTRDASWS